MLLFKKKSKLTVASYMMQLITVKNKKEWKRQ